MGTAIRRLVSVASLGAMPALMPQSTAAAWKGHGQNGCTPDGRYGIAVHAHAHPSPCIAAPGHLAVESAYYQNASKLGGTALAAFPEVRLRYGVARGVEFFMDAPSEIAKSGDYGAGLYVMTPYGYGLAIALPVDRPASAAVRVELRPPLPPLAPIDCTPRASVSLDAAQALGEVATAGVSFGLLRSGDADESRFHDAPSMLVSLGRRLPDGTTVAVETCIHGGYGIGDVAQRFGVLAVERNVAPHLRLSIEVGTAFNPSGGTKPHYLAFGLTR